MNRYERRRHGKTNPPDAGAMLRLGFARHQAGDLSGAEILYRRAVAAAPGDPDAARLLAEVLIDTAKFDEAITLLTHLQARLPAHFVTYYTLGNAYRLAGQIDAAISSYRNAIALNPAFAGAQHGMGAALRRAGRDGEAADYFAAAAKAAPDWAVAWNDLGLTLAVLGRRDPAAAALERALALDPSLAETRRHLLAMRQTVAPEDIAALQSVLADHATSASAKVETGFALGKSLQKAMRFDEAFALFTQANQGLRSIQAAAGFRFNRARLTADIDRLIAEFSVGGFAERRDWGVASDLPVFIVGMPRTGSSLVEQIGASHNAVIGLGEIKAIGQIARQIGAMPSASWSAAAVDAKARDHLQYLSGRGGPALRVIDKMPDNIFLLGLIATLFPGARIIFCERDAMDTCFSCFTQRFAEPICYDTDLEDCAFRYREVERLAWHWRKTLPLRTYCVSYEALVADVEQQSRKLIDFLGLQWDPACLRFHETPRAVKTASWMQVRQPAYAHAVGQAARYAPHLNALSTALRRYAGDARET